MKYFDPSYKVDLGIFMHEYVKYAKEWSDINGIRSLCDEDPLPIFTRNEFLFRLAMIGVDYINKELEYDQD